MPALAAAPLDALREYNAIAEEIIGHDEAGVHHFFFSAPPPLLQEIIGHDEALLLDDLSVEASPLVHALLIFTRLKDAVAMMRGVLARADARASLAASPEPSRSLPAGFLTGMLALPEPALREIYSRAVSSTKRSPTLANALIQARDLLARRR